MRALLPAIKHLLAGESVDHAGTEIRIPWAGTTVPLMLGGTGPTTMRLAGALADMVTLEIGVRPEAIRWALENISAGAEAAGRNATDIEVIVLCGIPAPPGRLPIPGLEKARVTTLRSTALMHPGPRLPEALADLAAALGR